MTALKLAFKNLIGAGLRTWLNVLVLSFAFVLIIFYNGMIDGWNRQGERDTIEWEIGQGQYWHSTYDKYDMYSYKDAHQVMSNEVQQSIEDGFITPVLIRQASVYPQGRMQSVMLRGIDTQQQFLKLPTADLNNVQNKYSAIIGKQMSKATKLKVGDEVLVRWRDKNETFDAISITIAAIFKCDVPSVDMGQMYLSLSLLQEMTEMKNEASYLISNQKEDAVVLEGWNYKDADFLLTDFKAMVQSEKAGGMVMQFLLLVIALLAIFDTQVLSIFRRQREIGTYIALGMTRKQVVGVFTVEGGAHSILAALLAAVWGIPLLLYINKIGISFGMDSNQTGITMSEVIYPYYSVGLIVSTLLLVVLSSTIVSYLPSRKISKMKPTDALKGKHQ